MLKLYPSAKTSIQTYNNQDCDCAFGNAIPPACNDVNSSAGFEDLRADFGDLGVGGSEEDARRQCPLSRVLHPKGHVEIEQLDCMHAYV